MTFKHKLSRRLAISRVIVAVAVTAVGCKEIGGGVNAGEVVAIVVQPARVSLRPGEPFTFRSLGVLPSGDSVPLPVSWSTDRGSIDAQGVYVPDTLGDHVVTATDVQRLWLSGSAEVSVVPSTTVLRISPRSATVAVNDSVIFSAYLVTGGDSTLANATWSSDGGTVTGNGTGKGRFRSNGQGRFKVRATVDTLSDSVSVEVTTAAVATVAVAPATGTINVGATAQLTAELRDSSGALLTGRPVSWSSQSPAVATVDATGLVIGVAAGTSVVTATSEGQSGSATITVSVVPVSSVTVSPTTVSRSVGQTAQLTATPRDGAGNPLSGRVVTWTTSGSGVATVNGSGLVTAIGVGNATITATSEGKSGTAAVTVTSTAVASVTITPSSLNLPAVGQTGTLTATPRDGAGNPLAGKVVTWSSSANGVATVNGSGQVTAVALGSATITATSEGQSGTANVTVGPPPAPGAGMPVYDAANGNHVLHVFEDWSTYGTPAQIATTSRVDGGGPWTDDSPGFQAFSTNNNDPWFGGKTLTIDYQASPAAGQSLGHGLNLAQGQPARYLNAASAKESIIIEWAWRWSGSAPYVGKIADWQPYPGTDRFNYQSGRDRLGAQVNNTCDNDALCNKYYSNGGSVARFSGLLPTSTSRGGAFARSVGSTVTFYIQNRGYPQVDWGGTSDATHGINLLDNTWRRTILRLTLNANGVMGQGRIEEWMQKAGEPAVKVMEYIGDVGGFDEGLVLGRNDALGGRTWISDGAILHLYNLTAVAGIFNGGSLVHLGYVRIWSQPREPLQ